MSNVRDFGASGDGQTDDTNAIRHALQDGHGPLEFPFGTYRITSPLKIDLSERPGFGLIGVGGAGRILMDAPGPAFYLVGSHNKSALPQSLSPTVWQRERMPTVLNLQIEGAHPEADGFWLQRTMQTTFEDVHLSKLRHGIRVEERARNVLISHCHIYDNRGVGVLLDQANLHQIIIASSHISYNRQAGIKIYGGEIRNFHFTGNDIEYNFGDPDVPAADIFIDCRPAGSTVREGTIVSNTIQAKYSPGGANVRILGRDQKAAGMLSLSGNLIGSQEVGVHLDGCRGVVVSANVLYSGHQRNLLIENSRNIVVGPNSFDHNPDYGANELATGIRLVDSQDLTLTGLQIQDSGAGRHTVPNAVELQRDALVEIVRCRRVTAAGLHILDGQPYGLLVDSCDDVLLSGSQILDTRDTPQTKAAIRWIGPGKRNRIAACQLSAGTDGAAKIAAESHVTHDA